MNCIYNDQNHICTNNQCPMCGSNCPVPELDGVCKYEWREEEYTLTPKGCLTAALLNHINLDEDIIDFIWHDFVSLMTELGYIQEED